MNEMRLKSSSEKGIIEDISNNGSLLNYNYMNVFMNLFRFNKTKNFMIA